MKFAYTFDQVLRCGGVRVAFEHCRELKRRGHDAAIYASGPTDNGAKEWIERYGVVVRPWNELANGADVLVSCWWRQLDALMAFPVGQRFHLVQGRDLMSYPENHEWRKTIEASMNRVDYKYLAVSEWAGASCHEPHIVPNGVDSNFWTPAKFPALRAKFRILIEGSTNDPYKGVAEALKAAIEFRGNHPNTEIWLMAPQDPMLDGVDRYIPGQADLRVLNTYQNSDVLIKATHFDGFGLPHLEAMACGLPLITTDAGGNMGFCRDDHNCLIVPVGNVGRMVSSLEALHLSKSLRHRLAQNGIMTAKKWTWERSVDHLLEAIK